MTEDSSHIPSVFDRLYKPDENIRLYHYCSTQTLLSILESGKIRFTDANLMNDGSEGRYGYSLFERAAGAILSNTNKIPELEGLSRDFFDKVDDLLSPKQMFSHPVIACFSREPDVLSQWRAYAEDGEGWSIGFKGEALSKMPATLLEVLYEPEKQLEEVRNQLQGLFLMWKGRGGEFHKTMGTETLLFASWLHAYKDPSFKEEREIRLLHELRVDIDEQGWQISDEGNDGRAGEPVSFRAVGSVIKPFIDIPFRRLDRQSIDELWYGPRNKNGPGNVIFPMTHFGHRGVKLRHSASFYRG